MTAHVTVTKPRRRISAECRQGCQFEGRGPRQRPDMHDIRTHVRETGHDVTVTDVRSIRFVAVDDQVAAR